MNVDDQVAGVARAGGRRSSTCSICCTMRVHLARRELGPTARSAARAPLAAAAGVCCGCGVGAAWRCRAAVDDFSRASKSSSFCLPALRLRRLVCFGGSGGGGFGGSGFGSGGLGREWAPARAAVAGLGRRRGSAAAVGRSAASAAPRQASGLGGSARVPTGFGFPPGGAAGWSCRPVRRFRSIIGSLISGGWRQQLGASRRWQSGRRTNMQRRRAQQTQAQVSRKDETATPNEHSGQRPFARLCAGWVDQRDMREAGALTAAHDLHHAAVIDRRRRPAQRCGCPACRW